MPCRTSLLENFVRPVLNGSLITKQDGWVQIPLHSTDALQARLGTCILDPLPSLCHVHGPVQRDDIDPCRRHALDQGPRVLDVNDGGHLGVLLLDLVQDELLIRSRELVVIAGTQVARPRVEDLDELRPALDLEAGVVGEAVGEVLEHGVQQFGLHEHHLLDLEVFLRGAAFDQVRGEGVRASHKAQHGGLGCHGLAQGAQGFGYEGGG
mmetsp:Transcript_28882/g.42808  ORF Transcript_28882/g.42808 Transcript_28882/m.42808 type:complete len:209 (+) Transcript_28882:164-790(+)